MLLGRQKCFQGHSVDKFNLQEFLFKALCACMRQLLQNQERNLSNSEEEEEVEQKTAE